MPWKLSEDHKRKLHEGLRKWLPTTKGKKKKHRATIKQIRALQYMNQGMSKRKSMIKAGYAVATAQHPSNEFFKRQGVKQMILDMGTELVDQGLTTKYMALKFKQWLEAEEVLIPEKEITTKDGSKIKIEAVKKPDTHNQIQAYKEWKKVMDEAREHEGGIQVKRKLTIEEFVTGKNQ